MSWLSSSFTDYAKHALNQAQASIDKALEIAPDQDPLADTKSSSTSTVSRPRLSTSNNSPSSKPSTGQLTSDWSAWGNATVNNLWESSFKSTEEETTKKKSNALKLGGQRGKSRSPTKQITKKNTDHKTKQKVEDETKCTERLEKLPENENNQRDKKNMLINKSSGYLMVETGSLSEYDTKPGNTNLTESGKLPLTSTTSSNSTLSTSGSSSVLSQSVLIKSTSSNSSQSTVTSNVTAIENSDFQKIDKPTDVLEETTSGSVFEVGDAADKSGWSEDDVLDIDYKSNSDQESQDLSENNLEHKRYPSIGSTASSSILMLQSSSDTNTESNGDRSDKSDEDSQNPKTPTSNLMLSTAVHHCNPDVIQPITDEDKITEENVSKRVITSPTHSEQSDLMVLSEERHSPGNVSNSNYNKDEVLKIKEILHAREKRLFTMNKDYADLQDELQNERQKSHELEQNLSILSNKHRITVQEIQEEFNTVEELKNHIEEELQSLKGMGDIEELVKQLEEKDQLIEELTMEGEKLSKASFNSSNNVKKLRQKEKEDEKIIRELKNKTEHLSTEIEKLNHELKQSTTHIKENDKTISDLNSIINSQSKELHTLRNTAEDTEAEKMALKSKLDACFKEIAELKQNNITATHRVTQETLSANLKAQEEAKEAISQVKESSENTIKQLNSQILELQEVICRLEQQAVWKEQRHRDQIQELHQRIEDADGRHQDLSTSIAASTQPLLRQIQLLQETQANQSSNWEKIERSLNEKLEEARSEQSIVELEKREMSDKLQIYKNKLSASQTQIDNARAERSQLEVELEVMKNKLALVEDEKMKESAKWETTKAGYLKSLDESRDQVIELQAELDKTSSALEEFEHGRDLAEEVLIASRSSTPPVDIMFASQTNILERSLGFNGSSTPIPTGSNITAHSSYAVEKLTSQLKHTQSEVITYQEQIRGLNLSKASLSTEITVLSKKVGELEQSCSDLPKIRKDKKEIQTRYDTLLQMYGEKAEEVHELQLDLTDVREAYKAQIEQLLSKVIK